MQRLVQRDSTLWLTADCASGSCFEARGRLADQEIESLDRRSLGLSSLRKAQLASLCRFIGAFSVQRDFWSRREDACRVSGAATAFRRYGTR